MKYEIDRGDVHSMVRDLSIILVHIGDPCRIFQSDNQRDFGGKSEENDMDIDWVKWRWTDEFLDSAGVVALVMIREEEKTGREGKERKEGGRDVYQYDTDGMLLKTRLGMTSVEGVKRPQMW